MSTRAGSEVGQDRDTTRPRGWFIVGAWIIYLSGWDLADPVREGWTYIAYSWTATAAAFRTVGALLVVNRRGTP